MAMKRTFLWADPTFTATPTTIDSIIRRAASGDHGVPSAATARSSATPARSRERGAL